MHRLQYDVPAIDMDGGSMSGVRLPSVG